MKRKSFLRIACYVFYISVTGMVVIDHLIKPEPKTFLSTISHLCAVFALISMTAVIAAEKNVTEISK